MSRRGGFWPWEGPTAAERPKRTGPLALSYPPPPHKLAILPGVILEGRPWVIGGVMPPGRRNSGYESRKHLGPDWATKGDRGQKESFAHNKGEIRGVAGDVKTILTAGRSMVRPPGRTRLPEGNPRVGGGPPAVARGHGNCHLGTVRAVYGTRHARAAHCGQAHVCLIVKDQVAF